MSIREDGARDPQPLREYAKLLGADVIVQTSRFNEDIATAQLRVRTEPIWPFVFAGPRGNVRFIYLDVSRALFHRTKAGDVNTEHQAIIEAIRRGGWHSIPQEFRLATAAETPAKQAQVEKRNPTARFLRLAGEAGIEFEPVLGSTELQTGQAGTIFFWSLDEEEFRGRAGTYTRQVWYPHMKDPKGQNPAEAAAAHLRETPVRVIEVGVGDSTTMPPATSFAVDGLVEALDAAEFYGQPVTFPDFGGSPLGFFRSRADRMPKLLAAPGFWDALTTGDGLGWLERNGLLVVHEGKVERPA